MTSSSPAPGGGLLLLADENRSKFTYRHLALLSAYSPTCPIRVIAHIDLDGFYAQCEMVRLGVPETQPLAVQQWQGLIAINYPARAFGIGRHCTVTDAKKLCPELIAQHVATWKEGDETWRYHDDAAANIGTHKVSLDPYRLESRKILAVIKESLPKDLQKVEKASIDEVFVDLSAHVHSLMLQRFPELAEPPPEDDAQSNLPLPPSSVLDWQSDELVEMGEDAESEVPDWDDVAMHIGSEIVRQVRAAIRQKLRYTCSAGVANSKMVSKLGSAYKKPNRQTVVRSRATQAFLSGFKVTKIRNLGGKLGEQVVSTFGTDEVRELARVGLDQMKARLGDDTGVWVFNTVRGIDTSEVNTRTQIKSMLSAKSFRPTISTQEQAVRWLRIFAADIYSRLVEEGVLEHKRRPRTMNLHFRHGGQMRSRSCQIPTGKALDEALLIELAKTLLGQIMSEGKVWPCANLSLSVAGFEDGVTGNKGIDSFLVKGAAPQLANVGVDGGRQDSAGSEPAGRKRRADEVGIEHFFSKRATPAVEAARPSGEDHDSTVRTTSEDQDASWGHDGAELGLPMGAHTCGRCEASLESAASLQSHMDWHLAKDLHDEERVKSTFAGRPRSQAPRGSSAGPRRGRGGGKKTEAGQSRLNFG